ncbi:hypothetical protein [Saccharospirillum alexandrii]|uniref:hypothetical protein n=1 Tax=Saccharospirillum alexandrii TaxID=2448477 RepID=UPI003735F56A
MALSFGLFWASFHTVNPSTLAGTKVIQGSFEKILCSDRKRRSQNRIRITIPQDSGSTPYYGYKFPVACKAIPENNVELEIRVVRLTILSLRVNGIAYLPLEAGVARYNLGERMFFSVIVGFPLWFVLRRFLKKIGFIRVGLW